MNGSALLLAQEPTCDPWQGLAPVAESSTNGTGCVQLIQVEHVGRYEEPALFAAVVIIVCLAAIVIAQLVRR